MASNGCLPDWDSIWMPNDISLSVIQHFFELNWSQICIYEMDSQSNAFLGTKQEILSKRANISLLRFVFD